MASRHSARAFALVVLTWQALSAQEYHFQYFGTTEGLNNLAVRQIYQDRAGFLWVSTENGIFRYDGERFEGFGPAQGIPASSGAAFGDAPDGSLLVGGDFGLYHQSGNRFEEIPLAARTVSWAQGIQSDGKGHTFVGTDAGLMELSLAPGRNQFEVRRVPRVAGTSGPEAYGIAVDDEIIWYGCGLELCRMDRNGTTVLGRESGLPELVWLVIRKDSGGNLWVRGKNMGVFLMARGQSRFRRPDSPVPPGALSGVPALDADGRMLFPSPDGLLIRSEKGWQKIDRSGGLRGTVYAAFEDRQQSLWIGLAGRGLARWRGYREWDSYTSESGLPNDLVYEILPLADGSLWVATEGGLFRGARRESAISWTKVTGVGDFPVHSVRRAPDGDVWIGTETHGAGRIHAGTGKVEWFGEAQGLMGKAPYTLRFDRKQQLWAATETGLFMARPPYRSFSQVNELPSTRFWTVAEGTEGTLWAGGAGGLFEYASGHWKNYTHANGLSNQEIISLGAGLDGAMWIGYRHGGGIDRIRVVAGRMAIEKAVQRRGSDGIVYFLEFDSSGRLWAGTERGVDVWDGSHWSHYDASDGLAWDDCNLNGFAAEADGTVWIGTSGGLSRFRPSTHRSTEFPASVVFTKLVMGRTDVSGQQNPSVGIRSNALTARYSVLNAPRENSVVFRYRLTPDSYAWTETTRRELDFAALSPGAYRLEVEARDSDGVWNGHGAGFRFEIMPPWYRKWWFIGACGMTPFLIAAVAVRLRILRAMKRERELVIMVEERTADLRRANEDFRVAAESSGDSIYVWDLGSDPATVMAAYQPGSEAFGAGTAWPTRELRRQFYHPDDRDRVEAAIQRNIEQGEPFKQEYRIVLPSGEVRHYADQGSAVRDSTGHPYKWVGASRDITDQKKVERANAQLASIVENADAAIVSQHLTGSVLTWNRGAERIYGYTAEEMIGRTMAALVPPDRLAEEAAFMQRLRSGERINHVETVRLTKSGEPIPVLLTLSPMLDRQGNFLGIAHVAEDITHVKELERQLAQTQKLESIGQLAAGIAHEINTPIQYIGDNGRFLKDGFRDLVKFAEARRDSGEEPISGSAGVPLPSPEMLDESVFDYLRNEVPIAIEQLLGGVDQVARIVLAMKEFSHPGPAEKIPVDINRTIESTVLVSKSEWKFLAELTTEFDPELPPVPCFAGEFNQVILNLIVNAAHAIADVVKDSGRMGNIHITTRRDGVAVDIRVSDTGCGIPKANQSKVFDPFFTTKPVGKGTGQGLAIAYGVIVQKHGGTIHLESEPGSGTTFIIRLPLALELVAA
jgi:PAS domain S-box-containing protein